MKIKPAANKLGFKQDCEVTHNPFSNKWLVWVGGKVVTSAKSLEWVLEFCREMDYRISNAVDVKIHEGIQKQVR